MWCPPSVTPCCPLAPAQWVYRPVLRAVGFLLSPVCGGRIANLVYHPPLRSRCVTTSGAACSSTPIHGTKLRGLRPTPRIFACEKDIHILTLGLLLPLLFLQGRCARRSRQPFLDQPLLLFLPSLLVSFLPLPLQPPFRFLLGSLLHSIPPSTQLGLVPYAFGTISIWFLMVCRVFYFYPGHQPSPSTLVLPVA